MVIKNLLKTDFLHQLISQIKLILKLYVDENLILYKYILYLFLCKLK